MTWECLFVSCDDFQGCWLPRNVNGVEERDWTSGPTVYEWANARGAEGWELVNLNAYGLRYDQLYRLVFKRPVG